MLKDPPRLLDDPAANAALRADLMQASEQHHAYATAYDSASKVAAFHAAVAAGAAPGASTAIGVGLAKGLLGVGGAVALLVAGAMLHARWQASAPTPSPVTSSTKVAPAPAPQALTPTVAVVEDAPQPDPQVSSTAPGPSPAMPNTAQRELRQLARIRAHMRAGEPQQALKLAEHANRELGESALWQEREGLAVLALFALERTTDAQSRARRLLERFPNSPFRAELERHMRQAHEP